MFTVVFELIFIYYKVSLTKAQVTIRSNKFDDRIEKLAKKEAFISLNDHKPNFHDHPTCGVINSSKSEIVIISEQILDEPEIITSIIWNSSLLAGVTVNFPHPGKKNGQLFQKWSLI